MKRTLLLLAACLFCLSLACAEPGAKTAEEAPSITVPDTVDVTLTLPVGTRNDVVKTLPAYAAGFSAVSGEALRFSVESGSPAVAEGVLKDDGTLYVIAHGTGETTLSVTAATDSGENGTAVVSVTVRDARRMLALILLGVLSVVLLVLLGKPSGPEAQKTPAEPVEPSLDEANKTPKGD